MKEHIIDPSKALDDIREAIELYNSAETLDDRVHYGNEIGERFEALDIWLCAKGFLPTDWS